EPARDGLVEQGQSSGGAPGHRSTAACHEHFWRTTVTLTAADVAEIMRLVEQSKFDELNLEIDGVKLTLRRSASGGMMRSATASAPSDAAVATAARAGSVSARSAAPAA